MDALRQKKKEFLKDVLYLSLIAFGGPGAHFTLFRKRLVVEKKYLSEDDFMELHSFCQLLPGPTSTQTIMAMGRKFGGPLLSFYALLIWVLPALVLMTYFAILFHYFTVKDIPTGFLKYIQPMVTGFILAGAYAIFKRIKQERLTTVIFFVSAALVILGTNVMGPYVFPLLLVFSGIFYFLVSKKNDDIRKPRTRIKWKNLTFYISIFLLSIVLSGYMNYVKGMDKAKPWIIFENNYRFGSLVFGGGNVLIPMMLEQFVNFRHFITKEEFITGVGLVQAIPGPVFSLSSYTGALIMKEDGIVWQIIGSIIGSVAIFLPGYLMVQFLFPVWHQLKKHPMINKIFRGILAASGGLILAAAYLLSSHIGYEWQQIVPYMAITLLTFLLVASTRVSSPFIVLIVVIAGIIF